MSSDARATVTMPVPVSMLTDFCICARRQPESAVNELAMQSPIIVVITGFIEEERTISGLFPVARMASPTLVLRKNPSRIATIITADRAMMSL